MDTPAEHHHENHAGIFPAMKVMGKSNGPKFKEDDEIRMPGSIDDGKPLHYARIIPAITYLIRNFDASKKVYNVLVKSEEGQILREVAQEEIEKYDAIKERREVIRRLVNTTRPKRRPMLGLYDSITMPNPFPKGKGEEWIRIESEEKKGHYHVFSHDRSQEMDLPYTAVDKYGSTGEELEGIEPKLSNGQTVVLKAKVSHKLNPMERDRNVEITVGSYNADGKNKDTYEILFKDEDWSDSKWKPARIPRVLAERMMEKGGTGDEKDRLKIAKMLSGAEIYNEYKLEPEDLFPYPMIEEGEGSEKKEVYYLAQIKRHLSKEDAYRIQVWSGDVIILETDIPRHEIDNKFKDRFHAMMRLEEEMKKKKIASMQN